MPKEYIKDENGDDVKTDDGGRLFYSTDDGVRDPDNSQTVYREIDTNLGKVNEKVDSTYNPSKGEFNK